jgi:hypothetical protein
METKSITGTVKVPSMSKTTPLRRVLVAVCDILGKRRKAFVERERESNGIYLVERVDFWFSCFFEVLGILFSSVCGLCVG